MRFIIKRKVITNEQREKMHERSKKYREKNREKILAYQHSYFNVVRESNDTN